MRIASWEYKLDKSLGYRPVILWHAKDGRVTASSPIPDRWFYWPLYPWMAYKGVQAIRELRRAHGIV